MDDKRPPQVTWVGDETAVLREVQVAAATVGARLETVGDIGRVPGVWGASEVVLVGATHAGDLVELGLPARAGVYLVGSDQERTQVCAWSMPLGAAVIVLPEGAKWLAGVLDRPGEATRTPVVAVVGGSGGVGASTLAAGLAVVGAASGLRTAVVDLDDTGGGLDLLLGAEAVEGWRWDRLAFATGQLGDLTARLPCVENVAVVSMPRPGRAPGAAAVSAVVGALERSHELVVVDVGRALGESGLAGVAAAGRTVVLTGPHVRTVSAAQSVLARLGAVRVDAVVRSGRRGATAPAGVAAALGVPLLGVVPEESRLTVMAEEGVPPGLLGTRRWSRALRLIVDALVVRTQESPRRQVSGRPVPSRVRGPAHAH